MNARSPTHTSQLKQLRKEFGISQIRLAGDLGVNVNSIINWENGAAHPSAENQQKLNDYFDCEVRI